MDPLVRISYDTLRLCSTKSAVPSTCWQSFIQQLELGLPLVPSTTQRQRLAQHYSPVSLQLTLSRDSHRNSHRDREKGQLSGDRSAAAISSHSGSGSGSGVSAAAAMAAMAGSQQGQTSPSPLQGPVLVTSLPPAAAGALATAASLVNAGLPLPPPLRSLDGGGMFVCECLLYPILRELYGATHATVARQPSDGCPLVRHSLQSARPPAICLFVPIAQRCSDTAIQTPVCLFGQRDIRRSVVMSC